MKKRSSDWWERIVLKVLTTRARPYFRYPGFGTGSKASARVNVAYIYYSVTTLGGVHNLCRDSIYIHTH